MSADALIKKYSRALFEAAESSQNTEKIADELQSLSKVFSQEDALTFFQSPFNTVDTKAMVAKSTLEGRCSAETFNFMILLVENERMGLLEQINENYQVLLRSKSGETEGTLIVADTITESFKVQVEAGISKSLNKKVKLKVKTDPALISGYKVIVGGWTMDDSAQFHLNKIKDDILKRGI